MKKLSFHIKTIPCVSVLWLILHFASGTHFNLLPGWTIAFFSALLMACLGVGQTSSLEDWMKPHQQPGGEPMADVWDAVPQTSQPNNARPWFYSQSAQWGSNAEITHISTQGSDVTTHWRTFQKVRESYRNMGGVCLFSRGASHLYSSLILKSHVCSCVSSARVSTVWCKHTTLKCMTLCSGCQNQKI